MTGNETPNFEIVPYNCSDEQRVGEVLGEMYDPDVWESSEQLDREGYDGERFVGKQVNEDGTLGEILVTFRLTPAGAGFQIARLAVNEAFQNMGIAKRVLREDIPGIVAHMSKHSEHCPPIYLVVDESNAAACHVYDDVFPNAYKTIVYEAPVPANTLPLDPRETVEKREHEALVSRVDIFERLYAYYEKALEQKKNIKTIALETISARQFNSYMTADDDLGLQDIVIPQDTDTALLSMSFPYQKRNGRHMSDMGIIPTCGREGKPAVPLMVQPGYNDQLVDTCTFYAQLPDRIQVFRVHNIPLYRLSPGEHYELGALPSPDERKDLRNFSRELLTLEARLFNKVPYESL